jgi:uncharacterized protein YcfJ
MQRLQREQLEHVVKMQLLHERNLEIRPASEVLKSLPFRAARSFGITVGTGSALTVAASLFVFRDFKVVKNDLKVAVPVLATYSGIDFGVNVALTAVAGKRTPERAMSVVSGGIAGGITGYVFGKGMPRPTIGGAIAGAVFGYARNSPLEAFGLDRY